MSIGDFMNKIISIPTFPVFVIYLGAIFSYRQWKRKIKPMDLTWLLPAHNVCCIIMSLVSAVLFGYCLIFQVDSMFSRQQTPLLTRCFLLYSFCKAFELLDTIFMMLRQKGRQISTLHVYHHSAMLILSDCGYRFFPWPCVAFGLGINSFVHIIVYGYYLLSSFHQIGPGAKQLVTVIQLAQFVVGLLFYIPGLIWHGFCIYGLFFDISMIVLFGNFYYRAYIVPSKKNIKSD